MWSGTKLVFQLLILGFVLAAVTTCVAATKEQADASKRDTVADTSSDGRLNSTKRAMVSKLLDASLKVAQATSLEELLTHEELQQLLSFHDAVMEKEKNDDKEEDKESDADRRARLIAEVPLDYDCMEREFDVLAEDFNVEEAATVYNKCRIVVLRNVFSKQQMERFIKLSQDFIVGLQEGWMDRNAPMYNGNVQFHSERSPGKWEVLHPDYFLHYALDFVNDPTLLDFVRHPQVLDFDAIFGGSGVILAEPGTDAGQWHTDGPYALGEESLLHYGLAGHDLPPYSINLATPMVPNLSNHSGLTEYCIGSSHVTGALRAPDSPKWLENDLFWDIVTAANDGCPPSNWRAPNVQPGDVIIWDYQIVHRSGANQSPHMRPLIFSSYCRPWFDEPNFGDDEDSAEYISMRRRQMADMPDPYEALCQKSEHGKTDNGLCQVAPGEETSMMDRLRGIGRFLDLTAQSSFVPLNPEYSVSFDIANKDVPNLQVIASGTTIRLEPGQHGKLTTTVGSQLIIQVGSEKDDNVKEHVWTVRIGQEQLILSQQVLKGLLRPASKGGTTKVAGNEDDSSECARNNLKVEWQAQDLASTKTLNRLRKNETPVILQKGQVVYKQGDEGQSRCYRVSTEDGGRLSVARNGIEIHDIVEGEYFGECSLIFGRKRSLTVTCVSDECHVREMQASDVLRMMESSPETAKRMKDNCCKELFKTAAQYLSLERKRALWGDDIVATFDEVDSDQSGLINLDELRGLIHGMDPAIPMEEIQAVMNFVDADADGTISSKEFRRFWRVWNQEEH